MYYLSQPGDVWHPDVCTNCTCHADVIDSETSCHKASCVAQACDASCPPCSDYVLVAGQCCGTCVQRSCPVMDDSGSVVCMNVSLLDAFLSNKNLKMNEKHQYRNDNIPHNQNCLLKGLKDSWQPHTVPTALCTSTIAVESVS